MSSTSVPSLQVLYHLSSIAAPRVSSDTSRGEWQATTDAHKDTLLVIPVPLQHYLPIHLDIDQPNSVIATTHPLYMDTVRLLSTHHRRTPFTFLSFAITHRSFSNRSLHPRLTLLVSIPTDHALHFHPLLIPSLRQSFTLRLTRPFRGFLRPTTITENSQLACLPHTILSIYLLDRLSWREEKNRIQVTSLLCLSPIVPDAGSHDAG